MRIVKYFFLLLIGMTACQSYNRPQRPAKNDVDSVYVTADIQWHQQHYPLLERQVFSIDLLSHGLSFNDTTHLMQGTGYNLYLSDVLLPLTDTCLQEGTYRMDSTAAPYTFLPYMNFEGSITGCYLLDIQDNQVQRIVGFTAGEMLVEYTSEGDIRLDLSLYTADSTLYHAMYQGQPI